MRKKNLLIAVVIIMIANACKKEFDAPPVKDIPEGSKLTIDSLRKMYTTSVISFTTEYSVYCVVTADEKNGNLYKNVYVQDNTGALNLRLLNSGGLYQGDSIRIQLKGTVLSKYNGMLQLDSVDVDKNVVKQKTLVTVLPQTVTLEQIDTSTTLQAKLIKLENVEFKSTDLDSTFADGANQYSKNRTILDCNLNPILVRTSGYANFAGEKLPEGNGSLVAILGEFNGEKQLYIRSYGEITMTGARCTGYPPLMLKDFENNSISSGGWIQQNVVGNINWTTNSQGSGQGGTYYAQCSNYSGGNTACETWLISPSVNLSGASDPSLSFGSAWKYNGTPMQVLVSTDYSSGSPSSATWTTLTYATNAGNFAWINSGNISLSAYKTSNVHIAFKYTGTNSDGSTWEIDDIAIKDN